MEIKFAKIRKFYKENIIISYLLMLISFLIIGISYVQFLPQFNIFSEFFELINLNVFLTFPMTLAFIICYNKLFLKLIIFSGVFQGIYFANLIFTTLSIGVLGPKFFVVTLLVQLSFLAMTYILANKYVPIIEENLEKSKKASLAISVISFILPIILINIFGRIIYSLLLS